MLMPKWRWHPDATLLDMGLISVRIIPQLFLLKVDGRLKLIVSKVVDDILFAGAEDDKNFSNALRRRYKLGIVVHLPGTFQLFASHNRTR